VAGANNDFGSRRPAVVSKTEPSAGLAVRNFAIKEKVTGRRAFMEDRAISLVPVSGHYKFFVTASVVEHYD
jgi:hypothetical protein